ncbi:haloacid dehalogenase superfamily, subfamily IA, variant 3 with third motif having DD or ED [Raineyella antarctica]|uniref:Haloacid dehalogenase superfamily, subfamily IA, variant 3 with third motif having DD or ED n=1 Tax=Raineyella antarctica TaxID=1577474 RepID=A0A1G6HII7_9ACTN|nr:HAD family phosphatase [Raineyella antarctica]SDB93908.1 haloacid dehalogenase superfamily, subfamily IA, variant 3 with third motif having DD or ED [Raineyella antarctica]
MPADDMLADDLRSDHRPAACLWDFDGTVADTEPIWIGSEYEMMELLGGEWNDEHAEKLIGSDLLDSARYMLTVSGRDDVTAEWVVHWMVDRVTARIRALPEINWRPGALDLLAGLRADGMPCALVSASWRPVLEAVLEHLPEDTFQVIVPGNEVTAGKPAPDPYLQAAAALGVDARDCIVLEDSPTGTRAGQAAGAWVVGIPNLVPLPVMPRRTVIRTLEGITPASLYALRGAATTDARV